MKTTLFRNFFFKKVHTHAGRSLVCLGLFLSVSSCKHVDQTSGTKSQGFYRNQEAEQQTFNELIANWKNYFPENESFQALNDQAVLKTAINGYRNTLSIQGCVPITSPSNSSFKIQPMTGSGMIAMSANGKPHLALTNAHVIGSWASAYSSNTGIAEIKCLFGYYVHKVNPSTKKLYGFKLKMEEMKAFVFFKRSAYKQDFALLFIPAFLQPNQTATGIHAEVRSIFHTSQDKEQIASTNLFYSFGFPALEPTLRNLNIEALNQEILKSFSRDLVNPGELKRRCMRIPYSKWEPRHLAECEEYYKNLHLANIKMMSQSKTKTYKEISPGEHPKVIFSIGLGSALWEKNEMIVTDLDSRAGSSGGFLADVYTNKIYGIISSNSTNTVSGSALIDELGPDAAGKKIRTDKLVPTAAGAIYLNLEKFLDICKSASTLMASFSKPCQFYAQKNNTRI